MGKPVKNYICIVDGYRRPSRKRNTAGRYRVGAKTEAEAKKQLQQAIGFGSIQVYYEDTNPKTCQIAKLGECFLEKSVGPDFERIPVRHANNPIKGKTGTMKKEKKEKLDILKGKFLEREELQISEFLIRLLELGYFNQLNEDELDDMINHYNPVKYIPHLTANGVGIGIEPCSSERIMVYLDPESLFDSNRRCGTYAVFPMKKREYQRFLNFFEKINAEKNSVKKRWMEQSKTSWCGSFEIFG